MDEATMARATVAQATQREQPWRSCAPVQRRTDAQYSHPWVGLAPTLMLSPGATIAEAHS